MPIVNDVFSPFRCNLQRKGGAGAGIYSGKNTDEIFVVIQDVVFPIVNFNGQNYVDPVPSMIRPGSIIVYPMTPVHGNSVYAKPVISNLNLSKANIYKYKKSTPPNFNRGQLAWGTTIH